MGICENTQLRAQRVFPGLRHPFCTTEEDISFFLSGGVCISIVHRDLIFFVVVFLQLILLQDEKIKFMMTNYTEGIAWRCVSW